MSLPSKPIVLVFVGYYLPGFKAGGVLSCVTNIVNHLHQEFQFLIVTRDRDLGDDAPYPHIKHHTWQTMGNARVYYLAPGKMSFGQIRRIVQETPHDLIYLNSFFEPLIVKLLINRKLGLINSTPIVLTPHGEFDQSSFRQNYYKKALFILLARPFRLYSPVTWHATGTVEAEDIMKMMNIRRQSIQIALQLPPIVEDDTDDSFPVPARDTNDIRVVFFSRISPEKNLDFALKVLSQVRTKVAFDIIGPIVNTAYWNECQQLLRELPTHVTARSLGTIKPSELIKTLSQYDLLLLPSAGEAYGQVIAESLIGGTQVLISTNTPWRNLEAKGLGWDLPLDDIDSFVRVVEEVGLAGGEARLQRRKAIKENIRRFFSASSAVADIRQLFKAAVPPIESCEGGLSRVNIPRRRASDRGPNTKHREYQVCARCIMDTSDSNLRFDSDGLCEYCQNFNTNILPNWHTDERGEKQLRAVAESIRTEGKGKEFDCIMGLSGGLDSSYLAYITKEKLGLRPLLFHVDAGWDTDQAVGNIEKLIDGLGLDLYTEVINWEEIKDLQVAFLRSQIAGQDIVQDTGFFATLYKFARQHGIKHVLTGGNFSTECCREPEEWGAYPGIDKKLILDIHRRFGTAPMKTFPIVDVFVYKLYYTYVRGMRIVKPLDLIPYVKKDAEAKLEQLFGWQKFQHKHHESRFTRFLEDYWLPRKFGFDRRRAHFSSLIMTGQMTRIDALERIKKPELDEHFLQEEFAYVANKLDLSVAQLQEIFEGENKTCTDYYNKKWLINLSARAMGMLGVDRRLYK